MLEIYFQLQSSTVRKHDPAKCSDKRAVCIINNYWTCPSCDPPPKPVKTASPADILSWDPAYSPVLPGSHNYAWYDCSACTINVWISVDSVAQGARCHCGGTLMKVSVKP